MSVCLSREADVLLALRNSLTSDILQIEKVAIDGKSLEDVEFLRYELGQENVQILLEGSGLGASF